MFFQFHISLVSNLNIVFHQIFQNLFWKVSLKNYKLFYYTSYDRGQKLVDWFFCFFSLWSSVFKSVCSFLVGWVPHTTFRNSQLLSHWECPSTWRIPICALFSIDSSLLLAILSFSNYYGDEFIKNYSIWSVNTDCWTWQEVEKKPLVMHNSATIHYI